MAGVMVAHSILQGGPGLECLSPVLYAYLITGSADCLLSEYPTVGDIPRTAATGDLLHLCQEVCLCSCTEWKICATKLDECTHIVHSGY